MKCIKLRIWCISRIECWQMLKKETLFEIGKVSCAVRQKFEQKWKSFELLTCSFRNVSWNIRIPLFFASHQSDLLAFFVSLYWPSIRCCIKKGGFKHTFCITYSVTNFELLRWNGNFLINFGLLIQKLLTCMHWRWYNWYICDCSFAK